MFYFVTIASYTFSISKTRRIGHAYKILTSLLLHQQRNSDDWPKTRRTAANNEAPAILSGLDLSLIHI